jgi:hypothetical protein
MSAAVGAGFEVQRVVSAPVLARLSGMKGWPVDGDAPELDREEAELRTLVRRELEELHSED